MTARIDITPETKVAAFLEAFPELEETLMQISPDFAKLKNPVLRRTVAKVANLGQAAKVGGVAVGDLINRLRKAAGLGEYDAGAHDASEAISVPKWFNPEMVKLTLDAVPLIESGDQPLPLITKKLNELREGDIFELVTPFVPAPAVDMGKKRGLEVWVKKESDDRFKTYFYKHGG